MSALLKMQRKSTENAWWEETEMFLPIRSDVAGSIPLQQDVSDEQRSGNRDKHRENNEKCRLKEWERERNTNWETSQWVLFYLHQSIVDPKWLATRCSERDWQCRRRKPSNAWYLALCRDSQWRISLGFGWSHREATLPARHKSVPKYWMSSLKERNAILDHRPSR